MHLSFTKKGSKEKQDNFVSMPNPLGQKWLISCHHIEKLPSYRNQSIDL